MSGQDPALKDLAFSRAVGILFCCLVWINHVAVCHSSLLQKHRLRLVATDGAFSMDGDIAPLREICQLAQKYDALVFIDECHATGFLGPNGR